MKLLLDAGLKFNQDFQVKMFGDESLAALLRGEVDALADSNSRYDRFLKSAGVAKDQMSAIAQSQNLPSDVFVVSNALNPAMAQQIQKRMIEAQSQLLQPLASVAANRKYQYSKFVPAADQDYDEMRAVYRSIGQESIIL
jgi:phosphonate transport system substrate-binding protein